VRAAEQAAVGVERQRAAEVHVAAWTKAPGLAAPDDAEVLELERDGDREAVVDHREIEVLGGDAGLAKGALAGDVDDGVDRVVPLAVAADEVPRVVMRLRLPEPEEADLACRVLARPLPRNDVGRAAVA